MRDSLQTIGSPHGADASAFDLESTAGSGPGAALLLTGNLGLGHHVVTGVVADSFSRMGWTTEILDCMALLGGVRSRLGDAVFRRLIGLPTLYDGLHFSHLRPGSRLARLMDQLATERLVPLLADRFADGQFDVVMATFATGASAIAKLARSPGGEPRPATVVLCTDVTPHSLWVHPGVDLFLVTSQSAAAAVRRHAPRASVRVIAAPVRTAFFDAPSREDARARLGIEAAERCVVLMGGGWGLGPLAQSARLLADAGVVVLAVAGHNHDLARELGEQARRQPRIRPFGYTDEIPTLMAASDLVLTTPGATTCSEARVVGRPLMLLDVLPGHGRDTVQHELELGMAEVCDPDPPRLAAGVMAMLERTSPGQVAKAPPERFTQELGDALRSIPRGALSSTVAGVPPTTPHRRQAGT